MTEKKTDNGEIHLGRHIRQAWGTSKSHPPLGYGVPPRQEGQRGRVFQKTDRGDRPVFAQTWGPGGHGLIVTLTVLTAPHLFH